jgi:hypothetical protein
MLGCQDCQTNTTLWDGATEGRPIAFPPAPGSSQKRTRHWRRSQSREMSESKPIRGRTACRHSHTHGKNEARHGPEPAPLFVEPLRASVDLLMKRAVPTHRFSIRKPRSPRRGFLLLWAPAIAASVWHADLGARTKPFSLPDENVLKQRANTMMRRIKGQSC